MPSIERQSTAGCNYKRRDSVGGNHSANIGINTYPVVNLHVSAKELKDLDVITKSDPLCVMYIYQDDQWIEFDRTEIIWNNLNPEWVTFFTIMYVFEIKQPLKFMVYDVDSKHSSLKSQDFIGEAVVDLADIISSHGSLTVDLKLPNGQKHRGKLIIIPEQVKNCASIVEGKISLKHLKKKVFTRYQPFFVISKSSDSGQFIPIYQSEVSKKLRWKQFQIPLQVLCNLDNDKPLRIIFYNFKKHKTPDEIASHDTTLSHITDGIGQLLKIVSKKNKIKGEFKFESFSIIQKFSYMDYLHGGIQLNLITSIDFTDTNIDPRNPKSLHYIQQSGYNQYETCIRAVGEILCPYDSDQLFPVLGFGARVSGKVNHCFPLTFNSSSPCVHGLDNILRTYHNALMHIQLSGPCLFAPTIRYATNLANQSFQDNRTYTILLILTDGVINDMADTTDAIVEAGKSPLSIIIIGVGDTDFSAMNVLDADDEPLVHSNGTKMVRDIVQFVPFINFKNKHYSALAVEVLAEIPGQICQWAENNGIRPVGT